MRFSTLGICRTNARRKKLLWLRETTCATTHLLQAYDRWLFRFIEHLFSRRSVATLGGPWCKTREMQHYHTRWGRSRRHPNRYLTCTTRFSMSKKNECKASLPTFAGWSFNVVRRQFLDRLRRAPRLHRVGADSSHFARWRQSALGLPESRATGVCGDGNR